MEDETRIGLVLNVRLNSLVLFVLMFALLRGKTRKYLNKETQKSRIVFSESIGKTDGDIMDEPVRVRKDQEEEEKEPKVDYTRQYE